MIDTSRACFLLCLLVFLLCCSTGCVWRPQMQAGGDITVSSTIHVTGPELPKSLSLLPSVGELDLGIPERNY